MTIIFKILTIYYLILGSVYAFKNKVLHDGEYVHAKRGLQAHAERFNAEDIFNTKWKTLQTVQHITRPAFYTWAYMSC